MKKLLLLPRIERLNLYGSQVTAALLLDDDCLQVVNLDFLREYRELLEELLFAVWLSENLVGCTLVNYHHQGITSVGYSACSVGAVEEQAAIDWRVLLGDTFYPIKKLEEVSDIVLFRLRKRGTCHD